MRNPYYVARLVVSLARLTADLSRLDSIFEINRALMKLGTPAEERSVLAEFARSSAAAEALRTRRRLGPLDPRALAALPAHLLGGAYGRFMLERGLRPETLPDGPDATEIEYILAHILETHDLWHVVTGFDTDACGEAGIQAFYLAQQGSHLPFFTLTAVVLNTALFAPEQKFARLDAIAAGWQLGRRARNLVGFDWRRYLETPLAEVRRELDVARS